MTNGERIPAPPADFKPTAKSWIKPGVKVFAAWLPRPVAGVVVSVDGYMLKMRTNVGTIIELEHGQVRR